MATAVKAKGRATSARKAPELPVYTLPGRGPSTGSGRGRPGASGSYDAAKDGLDNRRHWAHADLLDAVRANSYATRSVLRKRARYESANNCYARGMIEIRADDMVGIGPRLQLQAEDETFNKETEARFADWADAVDLPGVLRTMRKARIDSGEAFLLPFTNPELRFDGVEASPVALDLRVIEADQVESPALSKVKYTEGIRFDDNGVPVAYALLKNHPGGLFAGSDYEEIAAARMVHWFRTDRPGQIRGIPEITPALALYALLRRYTLATVSTAELVAELTLMLKTQAGTVDAAQAVAYTDGSSAAEKLLMDIERGMMTVLPAGYEPFQLDAKHPPTTYPEFKQELLKEIARCLNIPWNVAAGDSSGYNYASGRLDFQSYDRTVKVEQNDCERKVLNRIFAMWWAEMRLVLRSPLLRVPHKWFWRGRAHVDPAKEATAQQTRLLMGTTTYADEYAALGLDWREQFKERAAERAYMEELGLPMPQGTPSGGDDEGEETKDEAGDK